MTDHSDSRSLLLERLESRCMLAAGLFAHSVDLDEDLNRRINGPGDGPGGRQGAEIRTAGDAGNQDHRPANDQHHRDHAGRGRPDRGFQPVRSSAVISQSLISPPPRQGFGRPNAIDNGLQRQESQIQESQFSISVVPSTAVSSSNPLAPNVSASGPAQAPANTNPGTLVRNVSQDIATENESSVTSDDAAASRGAVLFAISAPSVSNLSAATADRVVDIAPDLNVLEAVDEALSFDTDSIGDVDRFIESSDSDLSSDRSSTWDGLIEPQLRLHSEWLQEESSSDEAAWEIRGETLRQLQDLATDPSPAQVDNSNRLTDEVIATWFDGAGGLVDIGSGKFGSGISPLVGKMNLPIHSGDFAGIVLDATVGLHRSVHLISGDLDSSEPTVRDGEAVRDAVLAAIAGEASSPVSPVGGEARPKLSSIAYPGAAILASTLAIIGRRKTVRLFNRTRSRTRKISE